MDINLNIKIKKNITNKLFFITSLVLLVFLIFSLAFQSMFFGDFYLKRKTNNLKEDVVKFKLNYSYNITDDYKLYSSMQSFEAMNNAKIAVLSNVGEIVYLPNPKNQLDDTRKSTLHNILKDLIDNGTFSDVLTGKKETVTTLINDYNLNSKNIVCISAISLKEKNDAIIIAYSPFQPIEEASSIIKSFYIYLALFALVVIIVLSIIYTNIISKPLVKINQVALKLSNLNFSETCPIESEDEIGNLAKTLNFLSKNLSNALDDLKIKNKKLEEDIEKERELEKLRKDFIAGASHELKTPIGIISGYAEGIKDGIVDHKDQGVYLDIIIDEAEKMNKLVMDMLELSKLEAGKIDLHIIDFSLTELTEEVLVKNSVDINKNNLTVVKNYSPTEDLYVQGDDFKIEQVLTNFVTNAIKYSEPNNQIIIDIKPVEEDKIYFSIENTGAHIPDSDINKIWTQFYRGDTSRNRGSRSTGLGLSIVKNLLQAHESEFGVMNTENGVKFYFTLKKSKEIDEVEEI